MTDDCPHRLDLLRNVRIADEGDPISGNKVALQADCGQCGDEVVVNTQVIETIPLVREV